MAEMKPSRPTRVARKKPEVKEERPALEPEVEAITMNPVNFETTHDKYAQRRKVGDGPKIGDPKEGMVETVGLGNLKVITNYGGTNVR